MSKDSEHLQWIYDRLVNYYDENPNHDYMIRFRQIIRTFEIQEDSFEDYLKFIDGKRKSKPEIVLDNSGSLPKGVDEQWATEFKDRVNKVVPLGEDLDTKYTYAFNKDTGETQRLMKEETLIPCFTVGCTNDNLVNGDKGCAVYFTVEAEDEFHAMDKAMLCEEFMQHIRDKQNFDRKYLHVHKPSGNYVIGKVNYFSGDPRL